VEWVLEENEEKWKEREREEMLEKRVEKEEEDVKVDPSPISSPSSSNVSMVGVEDIKMRESEQKLFDDAQDVKIHEMEEDMKKQQETIQMLLERDQKREKELEELKSQSKANNNKNESGEDDDMSQIDPTLDVVSDVSKMKIKQKKISTQVGNQEDTLDEYGEALATLKETNQSTLDEHGNEILELKEENRKLKKKIERLADSKKWTLRFRK